MSQEESSIAITSPRDGLPSVVSSDLHLQQVANSLAAGSGPVAIDAERASSFTYSQRAYLIQLRRADSGTHLLDPTQISSFEPLQQALNGVDWILHAASQDLVCLAQAGLTPTSNLFDTELAGRLLGFPRVALGTLVATELGFQLAKEHSAADWSTRPLPKSWLTYAALDVEFLIELWEVLAEKLEKAGKYEWAMQEFAHVRDNTKPIVRLEPWRRISGIHRIKDPQKLAVVRELWTVRDSIAAQTDTAPGRIAPDSLIVQLATAEFENPDELKNLPEFKRRNIRPHVSALLTAMETGLALPKPELPTTKPPLVGPPNPKSWQNRNPLAWTRLEYCRAQISALSEKLAIPAENLISPDSLRRILWEPPTDASALASRLEALLVRPWQQELLTPILDYALWKIIEPKAVDSPDGGSTEVRAIIELELQSDL